MGQPRLRRWVGAILAITLLALTSAAVLGSWRQAVIVRSAAAASENTAAYQRATYLAAVENALLQASLREPDGEERAMVPDVGAQLLDALNNVIHTEGHQNHMIEAVTDRYRALLPVIARYLALLDRGETTSAQEVLEAEIEPVSSEIQMSLRAEQDLHVRENFARLDGAERDSRLLQIGTVLTFLLGLIVLAVLGWSSRSHRQLIERMAAHDALTDLPNRAAFTARAKVAFTRARAGGHPPTVLVLDLDGFKDVNDTLGHHIGDLLLVEVGNRLRASVRAADTVARLGGDEFAVLLVDAEPQRGELVATRITQALNTPFVIENITLDLEASIGIATAELDQDVATVVRFADTAMYRAKEYRLGYTRFDPDLAHDTAARLTLLGDLRRALENQDEITLHYQPKVSVDTGELVGAEALARWHHPVRGPVPPNQFIGVLESTSLIHRFTTRVLQLALSQARTWLDAGHRVPVAVNVSTRCLLDTTFAETVAQSLLTAGVPGDLLCVEITENAVMADPQRAIEVLRQVRALGVRTAIDDFGTGYSSMAYLKILPVDEIKIDRSFVGDMATDHSNHVLVESAVDLGHNLGLTVVAEGVEDDLTLAGLHELGCDLAQGYHFSRPLPASHFAEYLDRRTIRQP